MNPVSKVLRTQDQASVHDKVQIEANGSETAVSVFAIATIQQFFFNDYELTFDALVNLTLVAKPIRKSFDKHQRWQQIFVQRALVNKAIACAEDAQKLNRNPDALRDLVAGLAKKDLALVPWARKIVERITLQDPYVNFREHALGVLAEACVAHGSEGFTVAKQILAQLAGKKENYVATVIMSRANVKTQLAWREAESFFRETIPQGTTIDRTEYKCAHIFLTIILNHLQGNTLQDAAKRVMQALPVFVREQFEQVVSHIADEEARKGNIAGAVHLAELTNFVPIRGDLFSKCVKYRAEMSDTSSLDEARELAENALAGDSDMDYSCDKAEKNLAAAEARKGVTFPIARLSRIKHLVIRTEAARDIAIAKGLSEGEAFFAAAYNDPALNIYTELDRKLVSDQILHAHALTLCQQPQSDAFVNAKQMMNRMIRSSERDVAKREIALCHAQKGGGQNTRDAIDMILTIEDPLEQSRAFGALALQIDKFDKLPPTDMARGYIGQFLKMINPPLQN